MKKIYAIPFIIMINLILILGQTSFVINLVNAKDTTLNSLGLIMFGLFVVCDFYINITFGRLIK